ncbi:hypothetical protein LENED_011108 [Lentinula edodes]|uniref:Uncharacterized protein n=1 Tax=Lentinula edodes TaxID=5353 RepID=A0A1Q3EP67_LENED|nr:hypothetical protein LENED_011108 [Lentinula edodes]
MSPTGLSLNQFTIYPQIAQSNKENMRFEFTTTIFLVLCLASTAYTLPLDASTPPPGSIISRAVSLTQTIPSNTGTSTSTTDPSTGTGTITFLGTHSGVPLLPHESPKISTAYEKGDIPRDVYTRVCKAVREVVPGWDAEERSGSGGKGVLAFSNSFEENVGGAGAGARGRVVQYGVIEIDRNGKVVQGSLVVHN